MSTSQTCCQALWLPSETLSHTQTLRDKEAMRAAASLTRAMMRMACTSLNHSTPSCRVASWEQVATIRPPRCRALECWVRKNSHFSPHGRAPLASGCLVGHRLSVDTVSQAAGLGTRPLMNPVPAPCHLGGPAWFSPLCKAETAVHGSLGPCESIVQALSYAAKQTGLNECIRHCLQHHTACVCVQHDG